MLRRWDAMSVFSYFAIVCRNSITIVLVGIDVRLDLGRLVNGCDYPLAAALEKLTSDQWTEEQTSLSP